MIVLTGNRLWKATHATYQNFVQRNEVYVPLNMQLLFVDRLRITTTLKSWLCIHQHKPHLRKKASSQRLIAFRRARFCVVNQHTAIVINPQWIYLLHCLFTLGLYYGILKRQPYQENIAIETCDKMCDILYFLHSFNMTFTFRIHFVQDGRVH